TPAGPPVTEAIIDVGGDKVAVAVHTAGVPHFVRVAPGIGGEMLTRALSERTGLSWAEAERAKLAAASSLGHDAHESLRGAVEHLVAEIRATLDFHSTSDPEHVAERALITGGGAQHPEFAGLCSRALGLPVEMLDPSTLAPLVGTARRARGPEAGGTPLDLAVSIGLCLGETA
ncbi:MAG: pilus assembly protein PilM, partial [Nocardioides sp.]|nr:pilus assembly protein PilM [Nocardioides sp.]